jgi:hypothetical protein
MPPELIVGLSVYFGTRQQVFALIYYHHFGDAKVLTFYHEVIRASYLFSNVYQNRSLVSCIRKVNPEACAGV